MYITTVTYHMAANVGVGLNLAIDEINCVSPHFILPIYIENSKYFKYGTAQLKLDTRF